MAPSKTGTIYEVPPARDVGTHLFGKVTNRLPPKRLELGSDVLFPNGGWDVHHHIFDPSRFAYAPDRHLTPPPATIPQYLAFRSRLGLTHSALTHGLSHGDDCTSLTAFTAELDSTKTRAIGVLDPATATVAELVALHAGGVRGVRVNLYKYGAMHSVELQKTALRDHAAVLARNSSQAGLQGWSLAFTHTHPEFWPDLAPVVREVAAAGIPVVTDHFALLKGPSMLPDGEDVTAQPGFAAISELMREGALYVKISAPYRVSETGLGYEDLKPLVQALVRSNPRRVLWGSDWPHTPRMRVRDVEEALRETPFLEVDDEAWLWSLKGWLSDEEWELMMVRNPRELYDSDR